MIAPRYITINKMLRVIIMSSSNESYGKRLWYMRNRERENEKSRRRYYEKKHGSAVEVPPKRAYIKKKKPIITIERKSITISIE